MRVERERGKIEGGWKKTYLPRRRMQHAYILGRNNMHQRTRLQIANLNKTRLKRQEIRVAQGKSLWPTLPANEPIRPRPPPMPVNKKRVLRIMQKKLAIQSFNRDGHNFFPADEIEGGVGLVEQRLRLQRFQTDDFESTRAGDAKLGAQKVYGGRFRGDVELLSLDQRRNHNIHVCKDHLERLQSLLAALEHLAESRPPYA